MKRLVGTACAALLATVVAGPAPAQDIKLFLADGSSTDLYQDKKSFALVIGVDEYDAISPDLKNAVRDARKVRDALEAHGFEVVLYDAPDMTGEKLRKAIDDFVFKYGFIEDSRILIWYAGHGATVDGEGYLLGSDAPLLDPQAQGFDESLRKFYSASVPLRSFGVHLRQMRNRHVMLVLDSCFAGTVFENSRASPSMQVRLEMASPARQIITAGLAGEEVSDNGHFADMFIQAISGKPHQGQVVADFNKDGYLSGTELGNFMASAARTTKQRPQYGKLQRVPTSGAGGDRLLFRTDQFDLDAGEFFFVLPGFVPPATAVASAPETTTVRAAEAVIWQALADGTSIENVGNDPVPVFAGTPMAIGDRSFDLHVRQRFPSRGTEASFEQATVDSAEWLRFQSGGMYYYVRAQDVEVMRPQ